jgi:hypothetical protein
MYHTKEGEQYKEALHIITPGLWKVTIGGRNVGGSSI